MKKSVLKKRLFALFLALALLLPMSLTAGATEHVMQCRLRGTYFNSLSEALKVYKEGDVIELLMELHRACTAPYGIEVRVRGVDGVRVYDDLFYAYPHQEVRHRVEGGVHIFKLVELERDPAWPEQLILTSAVPNGYLSLFSSDVWPGETALVDVEPLEGCQASSLTVLDAKLNQIPARLYEGDIPVSPGRVRYEFTIPEENLPLTVYATILPAGETDENCPSRPFADVEAGAWYHRAVDELVGRKVINGTDPHHFTPNGMLTRAEAVTILYRLMGSQAVPYSPVYADVPDGQWYTAPVMWATREGIVNGVGGGLFAPDELLTREALWTMLLRLSGDKVLYSMLDTKLALRAGEINDFAADAFTWAHVMGLVSTGAIRGKSAPTRAETAVTVYMYLQNREKVAADPPPYYPEIELNR